MFRLEAKYKIVGFLSASFSGSENEKFRVVSLSILPAVLFNTGTEQSDYNKNI